MSTVRTRSHEALNKAAEEAKMLEAAEAQAQEELGHRLSWEVLNLNRKFEPQQQVVDLSQLSLSKLTDMVEQIGVAVNSSTTASPPTGLDGPKQ
jgi:hypothetical protein